MPNHSISPQDLQNFDKQVLKLPHMEDRFAAIKAFYQRLLVNEEELEKLEYAVGLLQLQGNYDLQKDALKKEHQHLKDIRQTIDDRILMVEQKLYLGIPDDLEEMDRLIAEQESIVADQEKLNEDEVSLLNRISQIDVTFGKQLASIEQSRNGRKMPLKSKLDTHLAEIDKAEKDTQVQSKFLSFIPILIIPILLDFIAYKLKINGTTPVIFSHYVFLLSLIGIQIFYGDAIKVKIASHLAQKHTDVFIRQITDSFNEIERSKKQLETKYSIKAEDLTDF